MSLDEICLYHKAAREQRETEVERGLGYDGTAGFEECGCYDCDGYDYTCPHYVSELLLKQYIKKPEDSYK